MNLIERLHAAERPFNPIAPSGTLRKGPRRSYRKRYSTGMGPEREHAYVQNPPHVQPSYHAVPFISQAYAVTVATTAYVQTLAVTFSGDAAVPRGYRVIIKQILVWGVHALSPAIDPTAVGRWRITRNRQPANGLTELRPNNVSIEGSGSVTSSRGFESINTLHAPVHGYEGDVFSVDGRNTGTTWVMSCAVTGYIYPVQAEGDSLATSWADKPLSILE